MGNIGYIVFITFIMNTIVHRYMIAKAVHAFGESMTRIMQNTTTGNVHKMLGHVGHLVAATLSTLLFAIIVYNDIGRGAYNYYFGS
jgi:hypothetical protein